MPDPDAAGPRYKPVQNFEPARRHVGTGPDIDKDGLSDDFERNVFHSNPNAADPDCDGLSDWTSIGSTPTRTTLTPTATAGWTVRTSRSAIRCPRTPAGPSARSSSRACAYADGTFLDHDAEADCAAANPDTGSPFGFWHPDLVTMHVWLWYPNPDGLFIGENTLVEPITGDESTHSVGHVEADPLECADIGSVRHEPRCR